MKTYAFIGVGNMASAIIGGLKEKYPVVLYDKDVTKYEKYTADCYSAASSASDAVSAADYIVLAVKPQNFPEVLGGIAADGIDLTGKTFVSIAAGITISKIEEYLGKVSCIRTMPNTPLMIGKGVTILCRNERVSDEAFGDITDMFASIGKTAELPEKDMNAIISATGSSPAYVYLFVKAICDGAREQGLDYENMTELVCSVLVGSACMLTETGKSPEELIRMVTSPNGTTEKAMKVLYEKDFEGIIKEAMVRCTERAVELSKN